MKQTITSAERVNTGVAQSGYRGEVPESGYRGEVPESGYRGEVPESGYRGEVPKSGYRMPESIIDTLEYSDGSSYTFRFVPMNGGQHYQVDILDQPDYNGRAEDGHSTHRYSQDKPDSSHYICFASPSEANSLSKAKDFAQDWANRTYKYAHWGERF